MLPFLECAVNIEDSGSLNTEVYWKPTHTDQYPHFDSHHPLGHKLSVIRTLDYRAEKIPSIREEKWKEQKRVRESLEARGYPNWASVKSTKTIFWK